MTVDAKEAVLHEGAEKKRLAAHGTQPGTYGSMRFVPRIRPRNENVDVKEERHALHSLFLAKPVHQLVRDDCLIV